MRREPYLGQRPAAREDRLGVELKRVPWVYALHTGIVYGVPWVFKRIERVWTAEEERRKTEKEEAEGVATSDAVVWN